MRIIDAETRLNRFLVILKGSVSISLATIIMIMSICNYQRISPYIIKFFSAKKDLRYLSEKISASYKSDDLFMKYDFVNLNGLLMKICARRSFNEVTRLNNGMLANSIATYQGRRGKTKLIDVLPGFSQFLDTNGSQFVYVLAPCKIDKEGKLLPDGLENNPNIRADELLDILSKNDVITLDLRTYLGENPVQIEEYFYKTDHHWNADGSFHAFQLIMEQLHEINDNIDYSFAVGSRWERHILENWFLGSLGKRTGIIYAGVDPLIWYIPAFSTEMSCIIPEDCEILKGEFDDALIRKKYINEKNYFKSDPYSIYIGGNHPYVKHLNPNAPNKKKVLLIKDSFAVPVQAFMSTEFSELEVIDPRLFNESSIADFCKWNKPDLVIMFMNAGTLGNVNYANLGINTELVKEEENTEEVLLENYDVISMNSKDKGGEILPINLNGGATYKITFGQLKIHDGHTEGISMLLFDPVNQELIRHQIFDLDYSSFIEDNQWVFTVPEEKTDCQMIIYPGVYGKNEDVKIECTGITVSEIKLKH